MTTNPAIVNILAWQKAHAGQVAYSETASTRLAYDTAHLLSPTDCSGMAIRMYKHFGGAVMQKYLKSATYTGNLCRIGEHITGNHAEAAAAKGMHPGDLVFFTWGGHNPAYDHVAIYGGAGRIWNHGGPGRGPLNFSLSANVWEASEVLVHRYLQDVHPAPPVHHGPYVRHAWPLWMPPGHCFGDISASDMFHGGIDDREKAYVKLAQQRLHDLGYFHGAIDGTWNRDMSMACHAWHLKHAPHSSHMYSLTHTCWDILFTY